MKMITLTAGQKPHDIMACVILCGNDLAVVIGGGDTKHIGAVALGSSRPSLRTADEISSSASVLCRVGHKDDLPAREAALKLASRFNTNVAVTVGLHIDDASGGDIELLQQNFAEVLGKIEAWLLTIKE